MARPPRLSRPPGCIPSSATPAGGRGRGSPWSARIPPRDLAPLATARPAPRTAAPAAPLPRRFPLRLNAAAPPGVSLRSTRPGTSRFSSPTLIPPAQRLTERGVTPAGRLLDRLGRLDVQRQWKSPDQARGGDPAASRRPRTPRRAGPRMARPRDAGSRRRPERPPARPRHVLVADRSAHPGHPDTRVGCVRAGCQV